ncbi:MAG: large repetitive protein [Solirubrobacterales bacterium]|nr:large repetitive protein [Solirubrobacterales bacterium]
MSTLRSAPAVLVAAAALAFAPAAGAKTFAPTTHGDHAPDGHCNAHDCTLREAVIAANGRAGSDVIVLQGGDVYNLSRPVVADDATDGDLDISSLDGTALTVRSSNRTLATVDANGIDRVFDITQPATTFRFLKLRGGHAGVGGTDDGGGAINLGLDSHLRVLDSLLTNNRANDDGGAVNVDNNARLSLFRSAVVGNRALSGNGGGGGGILVDEAVARISKSTIAGNFSGGPGGGIVNDSSNTRVVKSTIAANRASGHGGGIDNTNGAVLRMTNDTVANNRTLLGGGGIADEGGPIDLEWVTVARNIADSDNDGTGQGGGLYEAALPGFTLKSSLIARNSARGNPGPDCSNLDPGGFVSKGHNLVGDTSGCTGFGGNGDRLNLSAARIGIGGLADNGGPTETIALLQGSQAIDNGANGGAPSRDQRGVRRQDPDIGAFERRRVRDDEDGR